VPCFHDAACCDCSGDPAIDAHEEDEKKVKDIVSLLAATFSACLIWNGYTSTKPRTASRRNQARALQPGACEQQGHSACRQALRDSCRPTTARLVEPEPGTHARIRRGRGPAAAAALSRRHLSIYLSAAGRVRVGLTRDASERGARAVAPHAMRADLW
jgi:hypothetical protein